MGIHYNYPINNFQIKDVAHMRTTVQFCAPDLCKFVSGVSWKPKKYKKFQKDIMLLLFVGL